MSNITNEDLSYIAGLFDGEGSIYYAKRKEKKKAHNGRTADILCHKELVWK